jgi:hypothetical protein
VLQRDRPALVRGLLAGASGGSPYERVMVALEDDRDLVRRYAAVFVEEVCGDRMVVDGRLYDVEVDAGKGTLNLKPAEGTLAPLKLTMATQRMVLERTDDLGSVLVVCDPATSIRIPPGTYTLREYEAARKDDRGRTWFLTAGAAGTATTVTVDGEGESVLRFGEPYVPTVYVPEQARRRIGTRPRQVSLAFKILGQAGETVASVVRREGSRNHMPEAPAYRIAAASGELITQGVFRYG